MSENLVDKCVEAFHDAQDDTMRRGATFDPPTVLPSLPSPLEDRERRWYYFHLPSKPVLVARTSEDPLFVNYTGPWSGTKFRIIKELRPVGGHPLRDTWEDNIAFEIHHLLDSLGVQWTSTDVVRMGETGTPFEPPVILWIGVKPASLDGFEGKEVAFKCQKILIDHGIDDVDVEIRESAVVRWAGAAPRLLKPDGFDEPLSLNRQQDTLGPLTSSLGIPISPLEYPWVEGTGGFFVSEGEQRKRLLLVTARHVVLPPECTSRDDNVYRKFAAPTHGGPDRKVSVLGPQAFDKFTDLVQCEIGRFATLASTMERYIEGLEKDDGSEVKEERRKRWELDRRGALAALERLRIVYDEEIPRWATMRNRFLGRIAVSPPIQLGAGTPAEGYTEDWAAIEVDPLRLDADNFVGNVINLTKEFDYMEMHAFSKKMPPSFEYSHVCDDEGLFRLRGVVSEDELRAEPTELDERVNEPLGLMVIKHGSGTRLTVGRANNVCSYVRTTYFNTVDKSSESWATKVSKEWPILPYDKDSGAFAGKGDSGAAVVDAQGRFVGMITGGAGHMRDVQADLVYVTPITFLLKRMEENGLTALNMDPKLERNQVVVAYN